MRKTARPVVWEADRAKSRSADPINPNRSVPVHKLENASAADHTMTKAQKCEQLSFYLFAVCLR